MDNVSFNVRLWKIRQIPRCTTKPWQARWIVGDIKNPFSRTFEEFEMADAFRDELKAAMRRGEAFSTIDGLPLSMHATNEHADTGPTWFEHAQDFVTYKWPRVSATNRATICWTIADITTSLLPRRPGRPADEDIRRCLRKWSLLPTTYRDNTTAPPRGIDTATWIAEHSPPLKLLEDDQQVRDILDSLSRTKTGQAASTNYFKNRRAVLYNVLKYAITNRHLEANPLDSPSLNWEKPSHLRPSDTIDPRRVGNKDHVEAVLTATTLVRGSRGKHLTAFFASMFYAMLRPSEATELKDFQCHLPETGWGAITPDGAAPEVEPIYTDTGQSHDKRGLKHCNPKESRTIPIPPRLVALLRAHIEFYGTTKDGRLFRTVTGNRIGGHAYKSTWNSARRIAFTETEYNSLRLKRPYDLRHSGISVRCTAGVPVKQVAKWAGHSVEVLLRYYSKVLEGYDERWHQQMNDFF